MNRFSTARNLPTGDTYPDCPVAPWLVDLLYLRVRLFDDAWRRRGARLPDDLASRTVAGTLRTLHRFGRDLDPTDPRSKQALAMDSLHLLRLSWNRAARRDAARAWERGNAGRAPVGRIDDLRMSVPEPSVGLYGDDPRGGQIALESIDFLARHERMDPVLAEAMVLRLCGHDWDDVQHLLSAQGRRISPTRLRQWGCRHLAQCQRALQRHWGQV
jgi:hypothetical protein